MSRNTEKPLPIPSRLHERTDPIGFDALVRAMQTGVFTSAVISNEMLDKKDYNRYNEDERIEAQKLADALKPEKNAALAVLLPLIWNQPQFMTIREHLSAKTVTQGVASGTQGLFNGYVETWFERNSERCSDPNVARVIERYKKIIAFRQRCLGSYDTPESHIRNGVATATEAAWGIVGVLHVLLEESQMQLTNNQARALIERAFTSFVQRFAKMNQKHAIPVLKGVQKDTDSPQPLDFSLLKKFFYLEQMPDGSLRLMMHRFEFQKFLEVYAEKHDGVQLLEVEPAADTTWCPAVHIDKTIPAQIREDDVVTQYLQWIEELGVKYITQR